MTTTTKKAPATIAERINKIAAKVSDKNYSTVNGKISDLLSKKGFAYKDCGCVLGPTSKSWSLYENRKGLKVKVYDTIFQSGKISIFATQF